MEILKHRGYTLIGTIQMWQDWSLTEDEHGLYPAYRISDDDPDLDSDDIVEYTFDGGDYARGDHAFKALAECRAFIDTIPENKEG